MTFHSATFVSTDSDSAAVGLEAARSLQQAFSQHPLRLVIAYAGVHHDQPALLRSLGSVLGPGVIVVGCSVQGVTGPGSVHEAGFSLGVMGLGGDSLQIAAAMEREFQSDSEGAGRALAKQVRAALHEEPKLMIVLYDPLCRADVEQMLTGLSAEVRCPLIGGGAGQPFGQIVRTYQYWQGEVLEHCAIAVGLAGPFSFELGVCHGTSPTGLGMVVTRSDGNRLLEIDGRPAVEVWCEVTGCTDRQLNNQDYLANWAIGIQRMVQTPGGQAHGLYFVRATFGIDIDRGAFVIQAAIPEGSKIMVHHRTADAVLEGTQVMAREMSARLAGRLPWAVLGFECGARASPFLGEADTLQENLALQAAVAPNAPWLGMLAWGEIAPVGGEPAFHNYTYPLLVLTT